MSIKIKSTTNIKISKGENNWKKCNKYFLSKFKEGGRNNPIPAKPKFYQQWLTNLLTKLITFYVAYTRILILFIQKSEKRTVLSIFFYA